MSFAESSAEIQRPNIEYELRLEQSSKLRDEIVSLRMGLKETIESTDCRYMKLKELVESHPVIHERAAALRKAYPAKSRRLTLQPQKAQAGYIKPRLVANLSKPRAEEALIKSPFNAFSPGQANDYSFNIGDLSALHYVAPNALDDSICSPQGHTGHWASLNESNLADESPPSITICD